MAELFCPKCGTTKGAFVSGFCQKCYLEDHRIVELPVRIDVPCCKKCGKLRVKGKWLEQNSEALKELVLSHLKLKKLDSPVVSVKLHRLDQGTTLAVVLVKGKIGKEEAAVETQALLVPKEIVCANCNLLDANYYEAVLQLRFDTAKKMPKRQFDETLLEIDALAERLHKKDSLAKVTNVEKIFNGFNVLIGSKRAAKKIVEHFERKHKARTKSSFTLAGVNASGKVKKRFTFLVRI